jgi:hypothetical protein
MKVLYIEPTPSPNSMKVNLDFRLEDGVRLTYTKDTADEHTPDHIRQLLDIPGVAGVFHAADFIAVDREPKADWRSILESVRQVYGQSEEEPEQTPAQADASVGSKPSHAEAESVPDDHFGEANVFVQKFRGIPLQIRVKSEDQEERVAMPSRFIEAAMQAQYGSPNLIKERALEDYGVRYGERKEIAEQILQELDAAFDDERLQTLITEALNTEAPSASKQLEIQAIAEKLDDPNWKIRFGALERLKPELANLHLIEKALMDSNFSIRRLATVYLGDIKEPEVFPLLYKMLRDPSASVRRTAGDCLSDIGDPDAIKPMMDALKDPSKIVRWRAARYLYEVGDDTAIDALRQAEDDPEFEVRMQIQYAIARIEGGEAAAGSVWQQMTRRER